MGWSATLLVFSCGFATRGAPYRRAVTARARVVAIPALAGTSCTGERVVVVGASGYIGRAVVHNAARRGYDTTAVVRDLRAARLAQTDGVRVVQADVCDQSSLQRRGGPLEPGAADVVICCLASRRGTARDAEAVDYAATMNCVRAAVACGCRHFVLLSAICVRSAERQEPHALHFQARAAVRRRAPRSARRTCGMLPSSPHAPLPSTLGHHVQPQDCKLRVEEQLRALAAAGVLSHSIVRPTAFFKSVCNQFERVAEGGRFTYFDLGGGRCIRSNPISERDLAAALVDTIAEPARRNSVWQIGGPNRPLSKIEQGALMAAAAGRPPPATVGVPIGVLHAVVGALELLARLTRAAPVEDAAEIARILRYYATEDMVAVGEGEVYGSDSLVDFYRTVAAEGREYDPYVAIFDSREAVESFGGGASGCSDAGRGSPTSERRARAVDELARGADVAAAAAGSAQN